VLNGRANCLQIIHNGRLEKSYLILFIMTPQKANCEWSGMCVGGGVQGGGGG